MLIQILVCLLIAVDIGLNVLRLREDRRKRTSIEWLNDELKVIAEDVQQKVFALYQFHVNSKRPDTKPAPTGVPPGPRRTE